MYDFGGGDDEPAAPRAAAATAAPEAEEAEDPLAESVGGVSQIESAADESFGDSFELEEDEPAPAAANDAAAEEEEQQPEAPAADVIETKPVKTLDGDDGDAIDALAPPDKLSKGDDAPAGKSLDGDDDEPAPSALAASRSTARLPSLGGGGSLAPLGGGAAAEPPKPPPAAADDDDDEVSEVGSADLDIQSDDGMEFFDGGDADADLSGSLDFGDD